MENESELSKHPQDPPKKSIWHGKKIIYLIIGVILLTLLAYGYNRFNQRRHRGSTQAEVAEQQADKFEQQLKELSPDAPKEQKYSYYLRLARAEYLQGHYEDAIKWLEQFPEEDKSYQGVWYTYAQIYQAQNNPSAALDSIKKAVIATPDNPQPWQLYFDLISDQPRQDQEAVYKDALAKTENDSAIVKAYEEFKQAGQ